MSKKANKLFKRLLLLGSIIGGIYCYNKHINYSSLSKNKLKIKENAFYEWKLGNVYYEKTGEGKPLLLIHDFSHFSSSYEWNKIISSLAETHTVYTVDLLGCGRSDKPPITYTNFLYVQMITDFIKNIIGEETTVITSGFSSSLAIMACNYNSNLFNKLILINPVNILDVIDDSLKFSPLFINLLQLPLIGTFIYNFSNRKSAIEKYLSDVCLSNTSTLNTDMIDTYYEAAHRDNGNGRYLLFSYAGNYMTANLTHGLEIIDKDILIIGGEEEKHIKELIKQHKELNDNIISTIIPKTKKLPHFESPEDVLAEIKNFL